MSEYQCYEFRAIDRPLTREEMASLRRISTRAEITSRSFTNEYQWGDLKADPADLVLRYFDAFVYVANWGTHRLVFRLPARFLDPKDAFAYCGDEEGVSVEPKGEHVLVEFRSEDEDGEGWAKGGEWMASLVSIRDDLMRGDHRSLYLGWLASLRYLETDDGEDDIEPPVPPGLAKLSAPLKSLAEFLRVDDELVEAAAAAGQGDAPQGPTRDDLAGWLGKLPVADKDAYLLRLLADEEDLSLRADLRKCYLDSTRPKSPKHNPVDERRTVAQLLAARDVLVESKRRKAAEQKAREQAKRAREAAEARAKHLDDLARREAESWREVETLIVTKLPKSYDLAVTLLVDLRDLAARSGLAEKAETRIRELRQRHSSKPSLIKRFDEHGLGK